MADFKKIHYHDLRLEAAKLPLVIGRGEEMSRLTRIVNRKIRNNVLLVGSAGIGKTTLVSGWISGLMQNPGFDGLQCIQFPAEHLHELGSGEESGSRYAEALATLPSCVLYIDDFGKAVYNNPTLADRVGRVYNAVLKNPEVRVILAVQPQEYTWLAREFPSFTQSFETVTLKSQSASEYIQILSSALPRLTSHYSTVDRRILEDLIQYSERFPALGQLPRSAISLLDESLAAAAADASPALTRSTVQSIIAGKLGIPKTQLTVNEMSQLKNLEATLNESVIGQSQSIKKIASTLQRAKLGMRNPKKPLGSFLMLGPSGVGKTETAKLVAEMIFGRSESFIRFDMSEFAQEHTVQRLIGAPAGYVGHESGGALTNALRSEPYSLVLLDEIEKAHHRVFDVFLQVLDDGRLTSGQNETVDARNTILMATSNVGVNEILQGINEGADIASPDFLQDRIMPVLSNVFRLEFLNRFDHILIFNPLTLQSLFDIARLEIRKVERRLAQHDVEFNIDQTLLKQRIEQLADPRFGARPIKRFIEETCESLLVQSLLNTNT